MKHVLTPPGINHAWRNVFWNCGPAFSTYGKLTRDGFDIMEIVECGNEDLGFLNAPEGDFHIKPDAPLLTRIGFRPIPVDEIGLYEDEHRASWPVEPIITK